jgi:phosphoenolpyruvate-protein kinase (PTS system EI component)
MSAPAIPHVKRAVRETDLAAAKRLARDALERSSASEVRDLLGRAAS